MAIPIHQALYQKVKAEADAKFLAPTSAYKSAWIVREYKKRGGLYVVDGPSGLTRWCDEKWVDLNRPNKPCGRNIATTIGTYPLCRPSVKVTVQTPKLASEIAPSAIKKANAEKQQVKQTKRIKF